MSNVTYRGARHAARCLLMNDEGNILWWDQSDFRT